MALKEEIKKTAVLEPLKTVWQWLAPLIGTLILTAIPQVRDHIWPAIPKLLLMVLTVVFLSASLWLLQRLRKSHREVRGDKVSYSTLLEESNESKARFKLLTDESYKFQSENLRLTLDNKELKEQVRQFTHRPAKAKLAAARTRLQTLNESLPTNSDIEEKYVNEYHSILSVIQQESDVDFAGFFVPSSEINHHETKYGATRSMGRHRGKPAHSVYSIARYCDRHIFFAKIRGAIKLIEQMEN